MDSIHRHSHTRMRRYMHTTHRYMDTVYLYIHYYTHMYAGILPRGWMCRWGMSMIWVTSLYMRHVYDMSHVCLYIWVTSWYIRHVYDMSHVCVYEAWLYSLYIWVTSLYMRHVYDMSHVCLYIWVKSVYMIHGYTRTEIAGTLYTRQICLWPLHTCWDMTHTSVPW